MKINMFVRALVLISFVLLISSCGDNCEFSQITPDSLPDCQVAQDYNAKIDQVSTCSYTSKSVTLKKGELPPGITLEGNGILAGKATAAGTYSFDVLVEVCFSTSAYGASNCVQKTKSYTLTAKP